MLTLVTGPWACSVGGRYNGEKSEHLPVGKSDRTPAKLTLNDVEIPVVASHKHLGVTFSAVDFSLRKHIHAITASFRQRVCLHSHMAGRLPPSAILLLYKCYVRPLFEYACLVWCFSLCAAERLCFER